MINFYSLRELFAAQSGQFPEIKHQHRSGKKVSDLKRACFNHITGLLVSDKMGEIGFINVANIGRLPAGNAIEEERKEQALPDGELPEFQENGVYKTLYGHQETCLGLEVSPDGKYVGSCDTLKKVNVTNWPNVFDMQSVLLEHT